MIVIFDRRSFGLLQWHTQAAQLHYHSSVYSMNIPDTFGVFIITWIIYSMQYNQGKIKIATLEFYCQSTTNYIVLYCISIIKIYVLLKFK